MKKILNVLALCTAATLTVAQTTMNIHQSNGSTINLPISSIDSVTFTSPPPSIVVWQTGGGTISIVLAGVDSITYTIVATAGSISSINCNSATNSGTLTAGTATTGVSSSVPYTGGNGGAYNGQTVSSTGVTGLTAVLTAGNFANGSGALAYTIMGTPSAAGTASFMLSIGGQICTLQRTVNAAAPTYPSGTVHCDPVNPTAVVPVVNPVTGRTWMDRNLGASQVATSSADVNAYGDLYQWGRRSDGHQCRNSATTNVVSFADQPPHGDFILPPGFPFGWATNTNGQLWIDNNAVNNPCPTGYSVPTVAEWNAELESWNSNDAAGAFGSPLKLTKAGLRSYTGGSISNSGVIGGYWANVAGDTPNGAFGGNLTFYDNQASVSFTGTTTMTATGLSVRCILHVPEGTVNSLNCSSVTNGGTLIAGNSASGVSSTVPYTGGNGGVHYGQSVTSIGVTGLTATVSGGFLANGSGSLTYIISGTPSDSGTARFNLAIGGQGCILYREVDLPPGSITSLNCNIGPFNSGILKAGITASGVSTLIQYTGGIAGSHNGQTVNSTGVTGLTATLLEGNFSNGAGWLTYTITGTPSVPGTANFALNIGGQSCTLSREVVESNSGAGVSYGGYNYPTIVLGNGQEWMAENLRTSTYRNGDPIPNVSSATDWEVLNTGAWVQYGSENPYGKQYNWFAVSDGRGLCPTGWHVPSEADWNTLIGYLDPSYNANGNPVSTTAGGMMKSTGTQYWQSYPYNSATNESGFSGLPGGQRSGNGTFSALGTYGYWWSSTPSSSYQALSYSLSYGNGHITQTGQAFMSAGYSVRCIKD